MANKEHDTTVVHTAGGGGAGWFIAGALVVVLGIGAFAYFNGWLPGSERSVEIELQLPTAE
ncbi:MAG: hypothetical protein JJ920_06260 [Roseitalea sp.]|jgi:hypothetical protein|nr:hypothetical protein [Roseitalea sp.]MBO6723444.1 hypothetical protein [Roseitalea sp.]MBO6742492.1 hypothetical protein [Roseitalea sp.]